VGRIRRREEARTMTETEVTTRDSAVSQTGSMHAIKQAENRARILGLSASGITSYREKHFGVQTGRRGYIRAQQPRRGRGARARSPAYP